MCLVLVCLYSFILDRLWNKQFFAYVNQARIRYWNQPVLSNSSKVSSLRKQRGPLMGLELTTDKYPPITSQTHYPLRHAASTKSFDWISVACLNSGDTVGNMGYIVTIIDSSSFTMCMKPSYNNIYKLFLLAKMFTLVWFT